MTDDEKRERLVKIERLLEIEETLAQQPQIDTESKQGFLRGLTQQVQQGVLLGFADEINAVLGAGIAKIGGADESFGVIRKDIQESERLVGEQFSEENPKIALAAQVGGGLVTGGAGAGRIAVTKVLQGGASTAARLFKNVARPAVSAAPVGAVFGAGTAEEGERLKGAAVGAATAAIAGPVLTGVVGTVTRAGRGLVKGITNVFRKTVNKEFDKATANITRAIIRDDDTSAQIAQRFNKLGPSATVADAGGVNLRRELERVASVPGAAAEKVETILIARLSRQGGRVQQIFNKAISRGDRPANEVIEEISNKARDKATPLYLQAYESPLRNDVPALQNLLQNPRIQKAIPRAIERIKSKTPEDDEFLALLQSELDSRNPSVILWDHVKRVLDDEASEAFRAGKNSLGSDIAGNVTALKKAVDRQVSAYAKARKIWAGSQKAEEAYIAGTEAFKKLQNPFTGASAKAAKFKQMSQAERELFGQGVSTAVRQVIRTADETLEGVQPVSMLKRIYGNKEKKQIINIVLPTAQRKELFKLLNAEQVFRRNTNSILNNSRTQLRKALQEEPQAKLVQSADSMVNAWYALSGNFFAMGRFVRDVLKGGTPTEGVNKITAERLLLRGGEAIQKGLKDVERFMPLPNSAQRIFSMAPKDVMPFLMSNPQVKKELDHRLAATIAGVLAGQNQGTQ